MPVGKKFSCDKQILMELYITKGLTIHDISKQMNISYGALHRELKEHNIPYRSIGPKPKPKLLDIIGNKCMFCDSQNRLTFHEIHGKKHKCRISYYRNHIKDFIPLCYKCHGAIHSMSRILQKNVNIPTFMKLCNMLAFFKNEACND